MAMLQHLEAERKKQQGGKWENENLAQVPYKVFRKKGSEALLSCNLCLNDSCFLTSSKGGEICLWNIASGELLKSFKKHEHYVTQAKLFYEDKRILSSSYDMNLCVSDIETGTTLWKSKHPGLVTSSDVRLQDNLIVSTSDFDYSINFWDFRNGNLINRIQGQHDSTPLSCAFSPDGQRVASCGLDCTAKIFDMLSQKTTVTLTGHSNVISHCRFSNNQLSLATTSWDKTVRIWDISAGGFRLDGSVALQDGHVGSVSCSKFNSDDTCLISSGYDQSVCVWDIKNKSKIIALRGHEGWVNSIDITADDRFVLTVSDDGTARLWDVKKINDIPLVKNVLRNMTGGLVKCEKCEKPFIMPAKEQAGSDIVCVFCRLAESEANQHAEER